MAQYPATGRPALDIRAETPPVPQSAAPAPVPEPPATYGTPSERARRISLAEWHLREAVMVAAAGEDANEEYHLFAAAEFVTLAGGKVAETTVDVIRYEIERLKEL